MQIGFIKKHLSDIRLYIIFSVIFFLISFFLGIVFAKENPAAAAEIIDELRKIFEGAGEPSAANLFIFILLRNVFASFVVLTLGVILGLFPLLGLFANGMMLGIVAFPFLSKVYFLLFFLAGILPHGIFELPAFFLAAATGFWLGVAAFRWLVFDRSGFKNKFAQSIKFFVFVIAPLLTLAAFVESFITPKILAFLIDG